MRNWNSFSIFSLVIAYSVKWELGDLRGRDSFSACPEAAGEAFIQLSHTINSKIHLWGPAVHWATILPHSLCAFLLCQLHPKPPQPGTDSGPSPERGSSSQHDRTGRWGHRTELCLPPILAFSPSPALTGEATIHAGTGKATLLSTGTIASGKSAPLLLHAKLSIMWVWVPSETTPSL